MSGGGSSAAFLWDMQSFFDTIDHGLLLERALKYGFPLVLVTMAISSYTAPRILQTREGRADAVYPTRGIIAGCVLAKALVHLYYVEPMDGFISRSPSAELDIYIDDITVSTNKSSDDEVFFVLTAAAVDMEDLICSELRCTIAKHKASVVASTPGLASRIRTQVGQFAGRTVDTAANLGIDYSGGRRRKRNAAGRCG